jgi:hypothetical protein
VPQLLECLCCDFISCLMAFLLHFLPSYISYFSSSLFFV